MPKKTKDEKGHLKTIQYLLAGILLKKDVTLKQVAKIIACSDKTLTAMYPERKVRKKWQKK